MEKIVQVVVGEKEQVSQKAAERIMTLLQEKPNALLCIAGGDTPLLTMQYLLEAHQEKRIDLNKIYLVQLDEWVGLDKENPGSCIAYIHKYFLDALALPEDHFCHFHAKAVNLEVECQKVKDFITMHGGIDGIILGVGVNGHLGFNEPGSKETESIRIVPLDATTKTVGEKYFTEKETVVSQGITLGIKEILESKLMIVQAFGKTKKEAIRKVLALEVDEQCPVTFLIKHPNHCLYIDPEVLN